MSNGSPLFPSSTGPYAGPDLPLDPDDIIALGGCVYDLSGVAIPTYATDGLLANGSSDSIVGTPTDDFSRTMVTLAYDTVGRWMRLRDAIPFATDLTHRITDAHIDGVIAAVGVQDHPDVVHLRQATSSTGGIAALLHSSIQGLGFEISLQLDRAVQLLQYFSTWPGGFAVDGPTDFAGSTDSSAGGCALGAGEMAFGVGLVIAAATKEVGTAGLATPFAIITAAAGVGAFTAGSSMVSAHCF